MIKTIEEKDLMILKLMAVPGIMISGKGNNM